MDLCLLHREVSGLLDQLDFESLFPGFHPYRFALYTDTAVCLDGELLRYDDRFLGNTTILYEGEYIAIWNMGADPIADTALLAASLVHEMFHCHQHTLGETRFPSDLTLLNYPADTENFTRKYRENCRLADAYEHGDNHALQEFAAIRAARLSRYPRMVREEMKAETLEGMAEFIGMKALAAIDRTKFVEKLSGYLQLLREESPLQFDVRRISYYTGTVLFLCLEKLGYAIRNEIGGDETVYEQTPIPAAAEYTVDPCPFIETALTALTAQREQEIAEHMASTPYTPCESVICGYDPMNMFRVGNRICCSHFIFLKINGTPTMISRRIVLELKDGSDNEIRGYY